MKIVSFNAPEKQHVPDGVSPEVEVAHLPGAIPITAADVSTYHMSRFLSGQRQSGMIRGSAMYGANTSGEHVVFSRLAPFFTSPLGFSPAPFKQGFGVRGFGLRYVSPLNLGHNHGQSFGVPFETPIHKRSISNYIPSGENPRFRSHFMDNDRYNSSHFLPAKSEGEDKNR
ncbi:hypothetical protein [Veronia pacifica]|uniref:Uncharacterized protein n=1 Tax=Veronia pacifica TaxID=1080227 RepID=A0A1C3EDC1_9GAMM|nr:hypothetical protein [Veronia pacifica]ODA31219.1 hypothetical protein A8L45_17820 [Veronia pacifica]